MPTTKTRQCVRCKKTFPITQGKVMLRGISFACNACYKKEQAKAKKSGSKFCEFC